MRNFNQHSTVTKTVFTGTYEEALATARSNQKNAPSHVGYTIEGEGNNTEVKEHTVWGGGNPPCQPIVHEN